MEEFEEITNAEEVITVGEVTVTRKSPVSTKQTNAEILKKVGELNDKDPFSQSSDLTPPTVKVGHTKPVSSFDEELPTLEACSRDKGFISTFIDYIQSSRFYNYISHLSSNKKVSKKIIAKTFFSHILGSIGDVFEIAINTVEDIVIGVVKILTDILKASAHLICNTARSIARVFTLNNTCIQK